MRLFKKKWRIEIPANATFIAKGKKHIVSWTDGRGEKKSAPMVVLEDGKEMVEITGKTWMVRYRDALGMEQE